jgi:hypothetical protein
MFFRKGTALADRRDVTVFNRSLVRFFRRLFQAEFLSAKITTKSADDQGGCGKAGSVTPK